ncbi:PLD nuclease N-terminal domain-containing protein [Desulfovibrio sp. OttesenSCG-928-A18]|nr:PLD nuclease N-terminal domain-containing protein [Desulfovibrio sp. OttesenSCG-928-A18]
MPMTDLSLGALVFVGFLAIPNLFGIWHAFHRIFPSNQERLIWIGVCIFVPVLGGICYLIFGFRRARKYDPDLDGPDVPGRG